MWWTVSTREESMVQQGQNIAAFLGEIKTSHTPKGKNILCKSPKWFNFAFLMDIAAKLNHLNCELQGKGKNAVRHSMIGAVDAFRIKMNIFSVHLQGKKFLHIPFCTISTKWPCPCIWGLGQECRKKKKYSHLISKLGQEFEERFHDFDKLKPCVSYISNTFMQVEMHFWELREAFKIKMGDKRLLEMEVRAFEFGERRIRNDWLIKMSIGKE